MRISSSALAVLLLATACGGRERSIETKLERHLTVRSLSVKWVRCVAMRGSVYRCNVNFGDPHIQIYCTAVLDGELRAAEWRSQRRPSAADCERRLRS